MGIKISDAHTKVWLWHFLPNADELNFMQHWWQYLSSNVCIYHMWYNRHEWMISVFNLKGVPCTILSTKEWFCHTIKILSISQYYMVHVVKLSWVLNQSQVLSLSFLIFWGLLLIFSYLYLPINCIKLC